MAENGQKNMSDTEKGKVLFLFCLMSTLLPESGIQKTDLEISSADNMGQQKLTSNLKMAHCPVKIGCN